MECKKCLEFFMLMEDVVKGFYVFFEEDYVNVE